MRESNEAKFIDMVMEKESPLELFSNKLENVTMILKVSSKHKNKEANLMIGNVGER